MFDAVNHPHTVQIVLNLPRVLVALVRADALDAVSARIAAGYEKRTQIKPSLFVSRPAQGATLLKS
jgi:hypothetical protein